MKNNILKICLSILLLTTITTPAFATENIQELEEIPEEILEQSEENIPSDDLEDGMRIEDTEEFEEGDIDEEDGDESTLVNAISTSESEENNCQITMTANLPEDFGLNLFVNIMNKGTGTIYQLPLYAINEYEQRCFVPAGAYMVTDISVFNDNTGTYRFTYPEDFILTKGQAKDLSTTLQNYENVEKAIEKKRGDDGKQDESPMVAEKKDEFKAKTKWEVKHEGDGLGAVGITGTQVKEFNIIIKIIKTGVLGTTAFQYSMDGGLTWSVETKVPLSASVELLYIKDNGDSDSSGLYANFDVTPEHTEDGFVKGDLYRIYVPDPQTKVVIEQGEDGDAEISVEAINPEQHPYDLLEASGAIIKVKIVKDGLPGTAVMRVSIDGGSTYSDEMYVPKEGSFELPDIGVRVLFDGQKLATGDIYTIKSEKESYLKAIIIGTILIISLLVAYLSFSNYMKKQIPKPYVYRLFPYTPYQFSSRRKGKK